jgi:hypothetical protein
MNLIELINLLTDDLVIVTRYTENSTHVPAILKHEDTYQVYTCLYSQYQEYSISELVDYFMKFVDTTIEYCFELVNKNEFEQLRLSTLKNEVSIMQKNPGNNENFDIIAKELEKYGGTYVLTMSQDVKFLIAACTSDEDYYYIYLNLNKSSEISIGLSFESCVGGFIPLIGRIEDKEYQRIQSFVINEAIETLDPKTLRPGYEVLQEKLEEEFNKSTEYVLFTPIYLIKNGKNERT